MGAEPYGIDPGRVTAIAREVDTVAQRGVEVALVVGAGNIYRGMAAAAEGWTVRPPTMPACSRHF